MKKPEFYISREIVWRWRQVAATQNGPLFVFSPYVTSRTAERVLFACREKTECHLYTLFDPEVFLNRSSSLPTLRKLQNAGILLYSLPELHGKVFISPNVFASIGSQNLTAGGTRHREATVVITDQEAVADIWDEVDCWRKAASYLSNDMLQDMESLLVPLLKKANELWHSLKDIKKEIENREIIRREKSKKLKGSPEPRELRERTARYFQGISKARRVIQAKVAVDEREFTTDSVMLARTGNSDMTEWILPDKSSVSLDRTSCYPCLIEGRWKLGFARVTKSRIAFVGRTINWSEWQEIAGRSCKVGFSAEWERDRHKRVNVTCKLDFRTEFPPVEISMWFDLHELEIIDNAVIGSAKSAQAESKALRWLEQNEFTIRKQLLSKLLTPFHYNRPFGQTKATTFFGPVGALYNLTVGKITAKPVLIATRLL
jgi:hypothetical protein